MRQISYMTGLEGVGAGQTALLNLPTDRRYHSLHLFYTETGSATTVIGNITSVRLRVNSITMLDMYPIDLIADVKLDASKWGSNAQPATGEIPIYFSKPTTATVQGEEITAWEMRGQRSFTMEVDFDSAVTSPGLRVLATYDFGPLNTVGNQAILSIIKKRRVSYNVPSGVFDMTTIPTNFPIQRFLLRGTAGITNVEVYADSVKVYEATRADNARVLAEYGLDATSSGYSLPIVFDFTQQVLDPLIVNSDIDVRITSGGAQSIYGVLHQRVPGYV
jgi:hypothetical protein